MSKHEIYLSEKTEKLLNEVVFSLNTEKGSYLEKALTKAIEEEKMFLDHLEERFKEYESQKTGEGCDSQELHNPGRVVSEVGDSRIVTPFRTRDTIR